jgi:uncharacterized protein
MKPRPFSEQAMTLSSDVTIATAKGSRYLNMLCLHWRHDHGCTADFTAEHGRVIFPHNMNVTDWPRDGVLRLTVRADALECHIEASAPGQREAIKNDFASHLGGCFDFGEGVLTFDWVDGD